MSERSGVGLVELAILDTLRDLRAGPAKPHIKCAKVVDAVEDRIGLAPGYVYEILLDLARPWTVPIRLVDFHGNYGGRDYEAAAPRYVECRLSRAGQLVLQAEAEEIAPVPVGLINGTTHRGGHRPPLNPGRAIEALRMVFDKPRLPSAKLLEIVGLPDLVTGCRVSGDLEAFAAGQPTALRLTGEVIVEDATHVTITTLPPNAAPFEVVETIRKRLQSPSWASAFPVLDDSVKVPVADIRDLSTGDDLRLVCRVLNGTDVNEVRQRLENVAGVVTELAVELKAPLATTLRSWVNQHRNEGIIESLALLEAALPTESRPK